MNTFLQINKSYLKYALYKKYNNDSTIKNCQALADDVKKSGKKIHWRTIYNNINGTTFRMSTMKTIAETLELDNNQIFGERFKIGE